MMTEVEQLARTPLCLQPPSKDKLPSMHLSMVPYVTVTEPQDVVFYAHKVRSRINLENPFITNGHYSWRYTYALTRQEAEETYENFVSKRFFPERLAPHKLKKFYAILEEYGIQEHRATIPVYTLHFKMLLNEQTDPNVQHYDYICPLALDLDYSSVLHGIVQEERIFVRRLGYNTVRNFCRYSPVLELLKQFSLQDFLQVEHDFLPFRQELRKDFEQRVARYVDSLWNLDPLDQDRVAWRYSYKLMRAMTRRMYDWFDAAEHAQQDYPLSWYMGIYARLDDVIEYMESEQERLFGDMKSFAKHRNRRRSRM